MLPGPLHRVTSSVSLRMTEYELALIDWHFSLPCSPSPSEKCEKDVACPKVSAAAEPEDRLQFTHDFLCIDNSVIKSSFCYKLEERWLILVHQDGHLFSVEHSRLVCSINIDVTCNKILQATDCSYRLTSRSVVWLFQIWR